MLRINGTFEVITPESAESGDYAESGFDFENEPFTFRETVDLLKRHPVPSRSPCGDADACVWFTSHPETDYRTGEETTYSVHYSRDNAPRSLKYWRLAAKVAGIK
jgi:hypothetical protein